jgi:hypothetical protein
MKASPQFKKIIQDHLEARATSDPLFAPIFAKENKNIDECINYIMVTVQKSGCNGFADDEIFSMAVHYYDEDSIKDVKPVNAKVVVNHSSGKTDEAPEAKPAKVKAEKPQKQEKKTQFTTGSLFD